MHLPFFVLMMITALCSFAPAHADTLELEGSEIEAEHPEEKSQESSENAPEDVKEVLLPDGTTVKIEDL